MKRFFKFIVKNTVPKKVVKQINFFRYAFLLSKSGKRKWHELITNKGLYYQFMEVKSEIMPFPVSMHVEPTTRCNLRCSYCARSILSNDKLKSDMDLSFLENLIISNPNLLNIYLQGLGEPLMLKNIEDVVAICNKSKLNVFIFTNGTTLKQNKAHRDLLIKYADEVSISLDTVNSNIIPSIREGTNVDEIIDGIKLLTDETESNKSKLRIRVHCVITKHNYMYLDQLVKTLIAVGIKNLYLNELENLYSFDDKEWLENHQEVIYLRTERNKILSLIQDVVLNNPSIKIDNHNLSGSTPLKGHCKWGFYNCFITANNYVTPCCKRMEDKHRIIEKPIAEKFESFWNSNELREFRKSHILNTINPVCDYCPT